MTCLLFRDLKEASTNVAAMQQLRSSAQKIRLVQIPYQIISAHKSFLYLD
jgi:hypothetical protein